MQLTNDIYNKIKINIPKKNYERFFADNYI